MTRMHARALVLTSVSLLALPAISAAQSRGPGAFAGTFSISSSSTVNVTSPITTTESRSTHEHLEVRGGSGSDMVFVVTNTLGDRCTLNANLTGATSLSMPGGQHCTMTDAERGMRLNLTLRSGSGSISGNSLSLSMQWAVASGSGLFAVTGSLSQRSSGSRTGGGPAPVEVAQPVAAPAPVAVAPVMPSPVMPSPVMMPSPAMPMLASATPTGRSRHTGRAGRASSAPATQPSAATPAVFVVPPNPYEAMTGANTWSTSAPPTGITTVPTNANGLTTTPMAMTAPQGMPGVPPGGPGITLGGPGMGAPTAPVQPAPTMWLGVPAQQGAPGQAWVTMPVTGPSYPQAYPQGYPSAQYPAQMAPGMPGMVFTNTPSMPPQPQQPPAPRQPSAPQLGPGITILR